MANQTRGRSSFISGTIDNNPLSNSGTSLVSDELIVLPAVDATQHRAIVLDPLGAGNGPEIVWVTSHTAGVSTATIVRGREGTSGVSHASTIPWIHAPTHNDFPLDVTAATRPSGTGIPYQGQQIYETDTDEVLFYNGVNWRRPWKLPWGVIGYAQITSNSAANSGVAAVTSLTLTNTYVANRYIRLTIGCYAVAAAGTGNFEIHIYEGSGTQLASLNLAFGESASFYPGGERSVIITPTVGSHTYNFYTATTGTAMNLVAAANTPAFILAEDIGPNGAGT